MQLLAGGLDLLSKGDLTCRIDSGVAAAYEKLRDDFNTAVARLSETVSTIQATSADVGNSAREINMGADDLSKRTEEQASSLEETAATTEELAASVKASAHDRPSNWRSRRCRSPRRAVPSSPTPSRRCRGSNWLRGRSPTSPR
jgi:methyl-accepting chemotaxis protein